MAQVNLIPRPRRHAAAARKRVRFWSWGVTGYAMVLLAGYAACAAALSVEGDDHTLALQKTTRQIDEMNNANASLKPQLAEAHTKLSVARVVGDQPDWSLLLAIISSTVDDEIVLTSTKIDPATGVDATPTTRSLTIEKSPVPAAPVRMTLRLVGMARSQAAVTQFVLRLERLGLFERVDLGKSNRQTVGATEANVFRIDCLLHRGGKPAAAAGVRTK
ncbi:MAG: PilN domain-containing protein [Anaerolineae bacterium]|nr:PilN domain-containing protein [Phycisphaerae bacterium]